MRSCESSGPLQGVSDARTPQTGKFKQAANGAGKAMSIVPTTIEETGASSTPYGKMEASINLLELYLTLGGARVRYTPAYAEPTDSRHRGRRRVR